MGGSRGKEEKKLVKILEEGRKMVRLGGGKKGGLGEVGRGGGLEGGGEGLEWVIVEDV